MTNRKSAERLGINYETLELQSNTSGNLWRISSNEEYIRIEAAALAHFVKQGWYGFCDEGGIILNLIKATSFKTLSLRHRSIFIEAIYAQNVAFKEDYFLVDDLLQNILSSNKDQVERNFELMVDGSDYHHTITALPYIGKGSDNIEGTTINVNESSCVLDYFPYLTKDLVMGLYNTIGTKTLYDIANIFSKSPYEYRKGWPDITIWKGEELRFIEIKSPNDRIRKSQSKVIQDVLKPLGLNVTIIDIVNIAANDD